MDMELVKALLFGIVEGVTEWLPISSTGHMILLNEFVRLDVSEAFYSMFEVVIQLGAIMAVVVLYWEDIFPFGKSGNPMKDRGMCAYVKKDIVVLWMKILVACIPAGVIGILFDEVLEALFYNYQTVALALLVFGAAFLVVEDRRRGKEAAVNSLEDISYADVFIIGIFQLAAAVFPGTSRSGATIVGALLLGISRGVAAEFTFFLAIPVMFGASLLKLARFGFAFQPSELAILLIGMASAFATSVLVIKFLMAYIKKHDFKVFGWYRIALGALVLVYFAL